MQQNNYNHNHVFNPNPKNVHNPNRRKHRGKHSAMAKPNPNLFMVKFVPELNRIVEEPPEADLELSTEKYHVVQPRRRSLDFYEQQVKLLQAEKVQLQRQELMASAKRCNEVRIDYPDESAGASTCSKLTCSSLSAIVNHKYGFYGITLIIIVTIILCHAALWDKYGI